MTKDVILYSTDMDEAVKEIEAAGGRVTHRFTDKALAARLPDDVDPATLSKSSPNQPPGLDDVSQAAAQAWQARSASRARPPVRKWDDPGMTPPANPDTDPALGDEGLQRFSLTRRPGVEEPEKSTGTPTSLYMTGSIAVGIVIVSGTDNALKISDSERETVLREVQEALNFLANEEPRAKVAFVYDIHFITVSARKCAHPSDGYEACEAPWRNAALEKMGYAASRQGSIDYARALKASKKTQWAYVAYFTKYPLHHFAYAVSEKVVMHYGNDGWGTDQINQVFAHETCHIFGAADEYGGCTCGSRHGHLGVPNDNCVNCPGGQQICLMNANDLTMCQSTKRQIGWDEELFPKEKSSELMA